MNGIKNRNGTLVVHVALPVYQNISEVYTTWTNQEHIDRYLLSLVLKVVNICP